MSLSENYHRERRVTDEPEKIKVFIASSTEQVKVAKFITCHLEGDVKWTLWQYSFGAGKHVLNQLVEHSREHDFAIILITPDDRTISRDVERPSTRDNLIFEMGLFIGSIGAERVFAITERDTVPKIISDYMGVTYETYKAAESDDDLLQALIPTCTKMLVKMKQLGSYKRPNAKLITTDTNASFGLEKVYTSFQEASEGIYRDLIEADGAIRIFINIASRDFGLKGRFFDVVTEIAQKRNVDLRVLHSSMYSPLFDRDRLASIGKNPDQVLRSLNATIDSLKDLAEAPGSTIRRRSHDLPFIWRLYSVPNRTYLMPYFTSKDADKHSPVLVFNRAPNSLHNVMRDWFDHVWEQSSPDNVCIADIVSPAASAGAALFLKWQGRHVFGIPKRDLNIQPNAVRFYGVGGKRLDRDEAFEACALREGREELSGASIDLCNATTTSYVRDDGSVRTISISDMAVKPLLVLEKGKRLRTSAFASGAEEYFLVGFEGELEREPKPSRELAAILLLTDECLSKFPDMKTLSIAQVKEYGGEIIVQQGCTVPENTQIYPVGTATFLIRNLAGRSI
jgi:predicted nucleotide-binding protein/ADP-ribose pyrophosphatase YjhB (NUDIX family)